MTSIIILFIYNRFIVLVYILFVYFMFLFKNFIKKKMEIKFLSVLLYEI